jgi:hypothetical protein
LRLLAAWRRRASIERRLADGPSPDFLARLERARVAREQLRARDPILFEACTAAFFQVDPAGVNYDVNPDEYEAEVGTVLARMPAARSLPDVERIVREELTDWFGEGVFIDERVAPLANELWALWRARAPS